MEQIFNSIEEHIFMLYWGIPVAIIAAVIGVTSMNLCDKSKSEWGVLWFFSALGSSLISMLLLAFGIGSNISNSGNLRTLVENESVSCPMIVAEKKSNVEYDYYRLECGRIKHIYARVPKFNELSSDRHYILKLNDHECITPGEYVGHCVDQAIAKYELYKDK